MLRVPAHSNSNGFTLMELLIVVTIIAIITTAMVPSFAGYIKNQGLKQATEQLKSDLRTVQNKALTGASSDLLIGGNAAKYWGVRFSSGAGNTGSNVYEYFVSDNNTTCPNAIPAAQAQGSSNISDDLQIKFSGGYKCLFFDMASGGVTSVPAIANSELIVGKVGSTASGDCRRLIFTINGLIYTSNSILCT